MYLKHKTWNTRTFKELKNSRPNKIQEHSKTFKDFNSGHLVNQQECLHLRRDQTRPGLSSTVRIFSKESNTRGDSFAHGHHVI